MCKDIYLKKNSFLKEHETIFKKLKFTKQNERGFTTNNSSRIQRFYR
jgi:hypothetical protein